MNRQQINREQLWQILQQQIASYDRIFETRAEKL